MTLSHVSYTGIFSGLAVLVIVGVLLRIVDPMVIDWRIQQLQADQSIDIETMTGRLATDPLYVVAMTALGAVHGLLVGVVIGLVSKPFGPINSAIVIAIAAIATIAIGLLFGDSFHLAEYLAFFAMSLTCMIGGFWMGKAT